MERIVGWLGKLTVSNLIFIISSIFAFGTAYSNMKDRQNEMIAKIASLESRVERSESALVKSEILNAQMIDARGRLERIEKKIDALK